MQITIALTTADAQWEVTTSPWVIMLWERKYHTKASRIPEVGLGLEDLLFMGWEASKMGGHTVPLTFDLFAQSIKAVEVVSEADEARPTHAAPSAG